MDGLKEISESPPILKQVDCGSGKPIIVNIDTSLIAIGQIIDQDYANDMRFVIKFGIRILINRQREYLQIKELLEVIMAMKANRNYLIKANVVLKNIYLLLLDIITNYSIFDIIILR